MDKQPNPFITAVPIEIQDQYSDIVDVFMCNTLNIVTLASNAVLDTNTCILSPWHLVVVWNILCFKEWNRFMQSEVLGVVWDTITIDMPFDFWFSVAANVTRSSNEMNVDGSITPVIFKVTPVWTTNQFDVNRLVFHIEDNSVMDSWKFWWLLALTNWIVIRKKDWVYKNIFNAKTNGDMAHHCQESRYEDKAPSWVYEFSASKIFNWQPYHWNVIRLDSAKWDEIEVIIRDNLTGLSWFHCLVYWHVVV